MNNTAVYLFDTNAYFLLIRELELESNKRVLFPLLSNQCIISQLTLLEINSVIGKYARGISPQIQQCSRLISNDGTRCSHTWYTLGRKGTTKNILSGWRKLIKEVEEKKNNIIAFDIIDFDTNIIAISKKFIEKHTFVHSFGSLDSIIAGTALNLLSKGYLVNVVTYDKALKAALLKEKINVLSPEVLV